jgi:hypothetical protein
MGLDLGGESRGFAQLELRVEGQEILYGSALDLVRSANYQAVSYWKIAEAIEPGDQSGMGGVVPSYLRRLIERQS